MVENVHICYEKQYLFLQSNSWGHTEECSSPAAQFLNVGTYANEGEDECIYLDIQLAKIIQIPQISWIGQWWSD